MSKVIHHSIKDADRKDIHELEAKIGAFRSGKMQEERFQHYRLTRGVYGQRQAGVQMFRTKLPCGKVTANQLRELADLAEKYGHDNLHITTRQNIQLHYVKLEDATEVWKGLARVGLTARGACGNTVRNITASAKAGIDPDEPFDITPYVFQAFEYFLRNPISQDMGRKIKIAYSSSEADSGFTYFHDFGFIARVRQGVRGFKVVIGGGLGAQSIVAPTVSEFMTTDEILPFMEAAIRVFDRYGEREKRHKARMKFLVKKLGLERFMELVEQEKGTPAPLPDNDIVLPDLPQLPSFQVPLDAPIDTAAFKQWRESNTFQQKQENYLGVFLKIHLGDLRPTIARALAELIERVAADDIRFTVDQNILLRFVSESSLPYLYNNLVKLGLADAGQGSISDITACPGTDTCALGVTNSTGLATALKEMVERDYPHLLPEKDILIKISGCMNSCGQHMAAAIGFHGSSIKSGLKVIPAMQIVLGGGLDPDSGQGYVADRIIKMPTKRIPEAVKTLLADYEANKEPEDHYLKYYQRQGKRYFYDLLKHLNKVDDVLDQEFFDWGQDKRYIQSIGVGECAGVSYDMVGAILGDAVTSIRDAQQHVNENAWPQAIYRAYTGMVIAAKGWLLGQDIKCNTHIGIIEDFDNQVDDYSPFGITGSFAETVLQVSADGQDEAFARQYIAKAEQFVQSVIDTRADALNEEDKLVVNSYYKA